MNSDQITKYPLTWPDHWARTPAHARRQAPFKKHRRNVSMAEAVDMVLGEIGRLRAKETIISTSVTLRRDGLPVSNGIQPEDRGAAVYFKLTGKPRVLACDKWSRVEDNLVAIAKHIDAIRGQERWGVGNLEQAFRGYLALPASIVTEQPWWEVLQVSRDATADQIREAHARLALICHPDQAGGSNERMAAVNTARDRGLAER
jgi:hypothetical protein